MGYDNWMTAVPDWPSVEDLPCESCGALPDEKCAFECECTYCLRQRAREDQRQRLMRFDIDPMLEFSEP